MSSSLRWWRIRRQRAAVAHKCYYSFGPGTATTTTTTAAAVRPSSAVLRGGCRPSSSSSLPPWQKTHTAAAFATARHRHDSSLSSTSCFTSSAPPPAAAAAAALLVSTTIGPRRHLPLRSLPACMTTTTTISSTFFGVEPEHPRRRLTTYAKTTQRQQQQQRVQHSRSFLDAHFSREASVYPQDYDRRESDHQSKDNVDIDRIASRQRWIRAMIPACVVHFSIGSVYAYSMWTPGMTTALGVIATSSQDWTQAHVLPVFSVSATVLGVTTSQFGSWIETVGPRKAAALGTVLWTSALLTTSVGVQLHSLPLVYMGWGVLGGIGWGLLYVAPLSSVLPWFPDQRGLASGITLTAFGCGAALSPLVIHALISHFAVPPDYIGPLLVTDAIVGAEVDTAAATSSLSSVMLDTLPDGSQVVAHASPVGVPGTPVVVATQADVLRFPNHHDGLSLLPGAYQLNSTASDCGVSKAMATLGLISGAVGMAGSRFLTVPHPNIVPHLVELSNNKSGGAGATTTAPSSTTTTSSSLTPDIAVPPPTSPPPTSSPPPIELSLEDITRRTSQFPLLWLSVFGNATGGLALLTSSKLMVSDIWAGVAPQLVTPSFATAYVTSLGAGMALGRLGWSAASDKLGRQRTYAIFGLGIPVLALSPALTRAAVDAANSHVGAGGDAAAAVATTAAAVTPMVAAFCGGSVLAVTFYGGVFSVLPAYVADLYGTKHAATLVGKLLTAFAASAVVGPMGLAYLRSHATNQSIHDLLTQVQDVDAFRASFGCSIDDMESIQRLVDAKTLTISRLMEVVPTGTVDPTPFLYDTTCYGAAALMGVAFVANALVKQPVTRSSYGSSSSTSAVAAQSASSTGASRSLSGR